jgi:YD repeat-containing protein
MTWDAALGVPLTVTDPNGDVTAVSYDALARPEALAQNGGPAHVHYQYLWSGARPTTMTYVFDGRPEKTCPSGRRSGRRARPGARPRRS